MKDTRPSRLLARSARRHLAWVALATNLGCAGAQYHANEYRDGDFAFQLGPLPAGYEQLDAGGVLLAFRNRRSGGTLLVNGRCGRDAPDVPLKALTQHLFLHFTERDILSQEALQLDRREALHTVELAKLDGVPKVYSVYVLKKNGCVYDFVHVANEPAGADFDAFVRGFRTLVAK